MLNPRHSHVLVVAALLLSVVGLSGCSASGNDAGGGGSLTDKAKTAKLCVDVAGSVKSATEVVGKVAHGAITQAEASALLAPIADEVTSLAKQNSGLPISKDLQKMSEDIVALQKVSPDAAADSQAAAVALSTSTKSVLATCTNIAK